jgi:hypothetical protein
MLWQRARSVPEAADMWMSKDPDQKLIDSINAGLTKKCGKPYPAHCVLLGQIYPDVISAEELNTLIHQIQIPTNPSFAAIIVRA